MTAIMNIPITLICDRCGKEVTTTMPFCNSEEYPIRMLTFNLQCGIVYRYDTCRCPAVEEGWDVNLSYGFWEALCPDCAKDAEE